MNTMVSVNNLSFCYGKQRILQDISFEAHAGRVLCIIGPNGSGKSTMARLIDGQLRPDKGEIRIENRPVEQYSPKQLAKKLAWVPQRTSIGFEYSCEQVVMMGRFSHLSRLQREVESDYAIVKDAMERCGVWQLKERSVLQISGGEWQRVLIARALCQQANTLLLDEPVSNLDIQHRAETLAMLHALSRKEGLCILLILHDIELAGIFSDDVLLLHEGCVVDYGETASVLNQANIERVFGMKAGTKVHDGRVSIQMDYSHYLG